MQEFAAQKLVAKSNDINEGSLDMNSTHEPNVNMKSRKVQNKKEKSKKEKQLAKSNDPSEDSTEKNAHLNQTCETNVNTQETPQYKNERREKEDQLAKSSDITIEYTEESSCLKLLEPNVNNITRAQTKNEKKEKEDKYKNLLSKSAGWDNVQIEQHKKHQSSEEKNKMYMWAMCFFFTHRIPSLHLDDNLRISCRALFPYSWLLNAEVIDFVRQRCIVVTEQMLVNHVPNLQSLARKVEWHMDHDYSEEMAKKSIVHNISVIEANPSTTSGTIDICSHLQKYCPVIDGKAFKVPCNVDQMSHERMTHSKI